MTFTLAFLLHRDTIVFARKYRGQPWHMCLSMYNFDCVMAVLSLRRVGFDPNPVHMGFVVDKMTVGQVFLPVRLVSPVIIIPPLLLLEWRCIVSDADSVIKQQTEKQSKLKLKPSTTLSVCGTYLHSCTAHLSTHNWHLILLQLKRWR